MSERFTKAELAALRVVCASSNGQTLVASRCSLPSISRAHARLFEQLGLVVRVNESWVEVTEAAIAKLEWRDELALNREVERYV